MKAPPAHTASSSNTKRKILKVLSQILLVSAGVMGLLMLNQILFEFVVTIMGY